MAPRACRGICSSKNIRIERSVLLAICRIGLPGAAQSALYSISNMTIQSAINGFGTVAVAAWSVYGKIDFLFWMTVSSFGIAVTTFAGQNFGARQYDRVRRGTMTCLAMTAGTTLCISLALYPTAQLLFRLFSSDDAVVAQGVQMMHYLVPVYMTYICIEIFSGGAAAAAVMCGCPPSSQCLRCALCVLCGWRWRCRSSMNFRWWNSATH